MIRSMLSGFLGLMLGLTSLMGAVVLVNNMNPDYNAAWGVSDADGVLYPMDSSATGRLGYFTLGESALQEALQAGNVAQLNQHFVPFGSPWDFSLAAGAFEAAVQANSDSFVGRTIYLWIASGGQYGSAEAEHLIFRFPDTFKAEPWLGATYTLSPDAGELLYGTVGQYSHDYGLGGPVLPGFATRSPTQGGGPTDPDPTDPDPTDPDPTDPTDPTDPDPTDPGIPGAELPLSGLVPLGSGVQYSEWLGYVYPLGERWVYHYGLGFIYLFGDSEASIWYWDHATQEFWWSNPTAFPFVYRHSDQVWYYFYGEDGDDRLFYHTGRPADPWERL